MLRFALLTVMFLANCCNKVKTIIAIVVMDHKLNKMHILRHIVDVKNVCFAVRVPF